MIEHPSGTLEVTLRFTGRGAAMRVLGSGVVRTARKLLSGEVFVPPGEFEAVAE